MSHKFAPNYHIITMPKNFNKMKKNKQKLVGNGDYKQVIDSVKPILKNMVKQSLLSAGSSIGGSLGSSMGISPSMGATIGHKLAGRISKLIGSGDYTMSDKVVANSLIPGTHSPPASASFGSSGTGTRIKHREFLSDVITGAPNTFNIAGYPIQPGSSTVFTFLSQIASNFEEYYVHGMVFEYVSTTSPYFAGGAMGSVIMALQYDAALPAFSNKPNMENSDYAISARPDVSMLYGIECKDQPTNGLYIRNALSPTTQPVNLTDLGNFFIATQTPIAAGVNIGELWVTYDIELRRPHISPKRFGWLHDTYKTITTSTQPTPSATNLVDSVGLGALVGRTVAYTATNLTYTFPNADVGDVYLLAFSALYPAVGTSPSVTASWSAITITNCTTANVFNINTTALVEPLFGSYASAGSLTELLMVTITGPSPTVKLTTPTLGVTQNNVVFDIFVIDIGNGILPTSL